MNSQKPINPPDFAGHSSVEPGFDVPDCLVQDLFVAQAMRAPERPAVISVSGGLSYGELLSASRVLGHRLQELGVKPNTLVAIVMDKGWEQVIGVLALLRRVPLTCQSTRMFRRTVCVIY